MPGGLFLCQATKIVKKKNESDRLIKLDRLNKIVLFRNSLEVAKMFAIDFQELSPIAYSRILGKMLFIRNESELIGVNFGDKVNIETIFKKNQSE